VTEATAGELDAGTVYCARCGYPLVGVTAEGKCPECGASAAEAISAVAFFGRDAERAYWTRVGLKLVLGSFGGAVAWGLIFGVVVIVLMAVNRTDWVERLVRGAMWVNGGMMVLTPALMIGGTYFLYYGITRVNKTGKAVMARVGLLVAFALYVVSTGGTWVALGAGTDSPLYVLGKWAGTPARFPWVVVLMVAVSLSMGLMVAGLVSAGRRVAREISARSIRTAYGAVVLLFALSIAFYAWELTLDRANRQGSLPALFTWDGSVIAWGGPGVHVGGAYMWQRKSTAESVSHSDAGSGGPLWWMNVVSWWVVTGRGDRFKYVEYAPLSEQDTLRGLSCGLGESRVAFLGGRGRQTVFFLLWPELLWALAGLLASGYLSLFVLLTGRHVFKALPRGERE
jgi:hypothetical protein